MTVVDRAEAVRIRGWTIAVMCLAVSLVMTAVAALNAAIPALAEDIRASDTALTWIVDAYTLVLAALLLPAGALGDRFGRRRALLAGLAIFAVGCAVPLVLDSTPWVIAARAVTGLGAALLMPATLSILTSGLPAKRRGNAIGLWAGTAGIGGFLGLLATGLLLRHFSWRSVFAFLAIAAALVLLAALTVPKVPAGERPRLDLRGTALSVLALAAVVFGLIEAPARGWDSPVVLVALCGGVALLVAFTLVELRIPRPLLDVRLFTDRGFGSGALALTMQFLGAFGVLYVLSQYLQFVRGYSALTTGLAVLPIGALLLPLAMVAPSLAARWGSRTLLCTGFVLQAVAMVAMGLADAESSYAEIVLGLLIFGGGLGLSATPATAAIMENVPPGKHGVASAVNDTTRETGAALGIALLGTLLSGGYRGHLQDQVANLPAPLREQAVSSIAAALQMAPLDALAGLDIPQAARVAFVAGMREAYLVLAVLLAVTAILLLVWAPGRMRRRRG